METPGLTWWKDPKTLDPSVSTRELHATKIHVKMEESVDQTLEQPSVNALVISPVNFVRKVCGYIDLN